MDSRGKPPSQDGDRADPALPVPNDAPPPLSFRRSRARSKKRARSPVYVPSASAAPSAPSRSPPEPRATRAPQRAWARGAGRDRPASPGPRVRASTKPATPPAPPDADLRVYEEEQLRAERQWYLGDEGGGALRETTVAAPAPDGVRRGRAARDVGRTADGARWADAQFRAGMIGGQGPLRGDVMDDDDIAPRVALLVKDTVPGFLSRTDPALKKAVGARTVVESDVVLPVKDPTSDMAIVARKGSALVKEHRENRGGGRVRHGELATGKKGGQVDGGAGGSGGAKPAGCAGPEKEVVKKPSVAEVRRSLPVFTVRDGLLKSIRENQVVVVIGETGSGKTTQLAQYLHEEGYTDYGMIGCTQPRRVAAVSVAHRVAKENDTGPVGETVGYAIRFEDCTSSSTKIKFMTDGILLRESLTDPDLDKYSVVIMDEAHERSLNTDVLFGALKGVISRRRDLKVIVTSATLNAEGFAAFFGRAPVFRIPGRTFPVDTFYSKTPVEDYVDGAVWQVMQIHLQAPLPGDVLVFMTGQEDIEATCNVLAEKISKLEEPTPLLILPIYSQLPSDLQSKIFLPTPSGVRKVVVATNIAETSLTIDGIRFVVDCGYCKLKTYNPRLGMDALLLCPASQASVDQRAGRAGRTGPGKCYRLFTGPAYANEMLPSNVPEIQRTNLGHVILLLKNLGVKDVLDFPFLDPPPRENVTKSMLSLWHLGALADDGDLTRRGRLMSRFPLDPGLAGLLFSGEEFGCLGEACTIVAMLSVPNVFLRPQGAEEESDMAREKFFVTESDHLTMLHTYQRWSTIGRGEHWGQKYFLNVKSLRQAREVREQLMDILTSEGMEVTPCDDWDIVRQAVASAFYFQAAKRKGISDYVSMRTGVVCGLHPTSAIFNAGMTPDYVVYHELVYTKREFMSCVTSVEPQWLANAKLGSLMYSMKVRHS